MGHFKDKCRNERVCCVCKEKGHKEGDRACTHYQQHEAVCFQGGEDPLSNFFPCEINWVDNEFHSSEQCYQYEKSVKNNRPDVAASIAGMKKAGDVKRESKKIYTENAWEEKNIDVMRGVIEEKVKQVKEVRDFLLDTEDKLIVEAVRSDQFWSCGLTKEAAANTDPSKYPGKNVLGKLYMELREKLRAKKRKSSEELENENKEVRLNGTTPGKDMPQ